MVTLKFLSTEPTGKGGFQEEVGKFAAELLGSNLNPVNIAGSFVPIGGQAKWAAASLKYGALKTGLFKGVVGGVAGQTAIEPFMHRELSLEQVDYGLSDSVHNILASGHLEMDCMQSRIALVMVLKN